MTKTYDWTPERIAKALKMRDEQGASTRSIAQALNTTLNTVAGKMSRLCAQGLTVKKPNPVKRSQQPKLPEPKAERFDPTQATAGRRAMYPASETVMRRSSLPPLPSEDPTILDRLLKK